MDLVNTFIWNFILSVEKSAIITRFAVGMISSVQLRDDYFIKVTIDKLTHFPTDISQMKHANTIPIN